MVISCNSITGHGIDILLNHKLNIVRFWERKDSDTLCVLKAQQTFRKEFHLNFPHSSGDRQQCVWGSLVRGVSSGSFISSSPPQASWSDNCRFAWRPTDHSEGASVRITISLCRILVYNNLKESGFGVRDPSLSMRAWQGQCCFVKRQRRPQNKKGKFLQVLHVEEGLW